MSNSCYSQRFIFLGNRNPEMKSRCSRTELVRSIQFFEMMKSLSTPNKAELTRNTDGFKPSATKVTRNSSLLSQSKSVWKRLSYKIRIKKLTALHFQLQFLQYNDVNTRKHTIVFDIWHADIKISMQLVALAQEKVVGFIMRQQPN